MQRRTAAELALEMKRKRSDKRREMERLRNRIGYLAAVQEDDELVHHHMQPPIATGPSNLRRENNLLTEVEQWHVILRDELTVNTNTRDKGVFLTDSTNMLLDVKRSLDETTVKSSSSFSPMRHNVRVVELFWLRLQQQQTRCEREGHGWSLDVLVPTTKLEEATHFAGTEFFRAVPEAERQLALLDFLSTLDRAKAVKGTERQPTRKGAHPQPLSAAHHSSNPRSGASVAAEESSLDGLSMSSSFIEAFLTGNVPSSAASVDPSLSSSYIEAFLQLPARPENVHTGPAHVAAATANKTAARSPNKQTNRKVSDLGTKMRSTASVASSSAGISLLDDNANGYDMMDDDCSAFTAAAIATTGSVPETGVECNHKAAGGSRASSLLNNSLVDTKSNSVGNATTARQTAPDTPPYRNRHLSLSAASKPVVAETVNRVRPHASSAPNNQSPVVAVPSKSSDDGQRRIPLALASKVLNHEAKSRAKVTRVPRSPRVLNDSLKQLREKRLNLKKQSVMETTSKHFTPTNVSDPEEKNNTVPVSPVSLKKQPVAETTSKDYTPPTVSIQTEENNTVPTSPIIPEQQSVAETTPKDYTPPRDSAPNEKDSTIPSPPVIMKMQAVMEMTSKHNTSGRISAPEEEGDRQHGSPTIHRVISSEYVSSPSSARSPPPHSDPSLRLVPSPTSTLSFSSHASSEMTPPPKTTMKPIFTDEYQALNSDRKEQESDDNSILYCGSPAADEKKEQDADFDKALLRFHKSMDIFQGILHQTKHGDPAARDLLQTSGKVLTKAIGRQWKAAMQKTSNNKFHHRDEERSVGSNSSTWSFLLDWNSQERNNENDEQPEDFEEEGTKMSQLLEDLSQAYVARRGESNLTKESLDETLASIKGTFGTRFSREEENDFVANQAAIPMGHRVDTFSTFGTFGTFKNFTDDSDTESTLQGSVRENPRDSGQHRHSPPPSPVQEIEKYLKRYHKMTEKYRKQSGKHLKHVFATTFGQKRGTRDDDTATTASTHASSVESILENLESAVKDFSKTVQDMTACANKTCNARCGATSDDTHTTTSFVTP
eukprot:scaffold1149_cov165-Amphora_coffeaeformis.AAC.6